MKNERIYLAAKKVVLSSKSYKINFEEKLVKGLLFNIEVDKEPIKRIILLQEMIHPNRNRLYPFNELKKKAVKKMLQLFRRAEHPHQGLNREEVDNKASEEAKEQYHNIVELLYDEENHQEELKHEAISYLVRLLHLSSPYYHRKVAMVRDLFSAKHRIYPFFGLTDKAKNRLWVLCDMEITLVL